MAATYVPYNAETALGSLVSEGVDLVRRGKDMIKRATIMEGVISDAGATPSNLEDALHGVATGKGTAFRTYLGSINTKLADVDDSWIANLDKGSSV